MKLNKLKSEFLKHMVKCYAKDHVRVFMFESFKFLYPDFDDSFISDALYALEQDGFVHVFRADGVAYETVLLPNAICSVEEDTLLRNERILLLKKYAHFFNQQLSNLPEAILLLMVAIHILMDYFRQHSLECNSLYHLSV